MKVSREKDEGDTKELCNCNSTYNDSPPKHQDMPFLRKKCGLMDRKDSRNITLIHTIVNNSVEIFTDSNDVRALFLEAHTQGEKSSLSCMECIFVDPRIK